MWSYVIAGVCQLVVCRALQFSLVEAWNIPQLAFQRFLNLAAAPPTPGIGIHIRPIVGKAKEMVRVCSLMPRCSHAFIHLLTCVQPRRSHLQSSAAKPPELSVSSPGKEKMMRSGSWSFLSPTRRSASRRRSAVRLGTAKPSPLERALEMALAASSRLRRGFRASQESPSSQTSHSSPSSPSGRAGKKPKATLRRWHTQ